MGRSEQRQKERAAAEARRNAPKPPTPAEAARPTNTRDSRRGSGVRNRGSFQLPPLFAPSRIGGRSNPTGMPARDAGDANDGGGSLPLGGPITPTAPAAIAPVGAQRSVPDPAGTGASGTQTGCQGYKIELGIAEESLGRKIADVNSFLSQSLPVVGYRDQSGREIRPTGDDLSELQGSAADGLISKDQLIFEGISTPGKNGVSPADVADNKRSVRIPGDMDDMDPMFEATGGADDDDFGGPDPEDYATNYSARRKAQRNAFLDPNITNSVEAVRASNNAIGVARFGNNFYANDGGNLRQIDKGAYDKQRSTGLSVDELKGAYVDSVKETLVPVAASGIFSPDKDLGPISEGVTLNSPVDMGDMAKTEFDFNNVAPGFSTSREDMKANYFSNVNYDPDDDED